jgi:hypothetical protein
VTERFFEFLVDPSGKAPRNLKDSIRRIRNASLGFRESWLSGEYDEAHETSQEAFEHFDYLQNELLRQRDIHKTDQSLWPSSQFKLGLDSHVGSLLNNISETESAWFGQLANGAACMPENSVLEPLSLEKALNKLKHRDTVAINFVLPSSGGHKLYVLTNAGMGQTASLSEIDVMTFCNSCKNATSYI